MLKHTCRAVAAVLSLFVVGALTVWAAESPDLLDTLFPPDNGETVRLRFDANGGSGQIPGAYSVPPGQTITLPYAQLSVDLESEDWHFAGWADHPADLTPDYFPGGSLTLTEDLLLYAVYAMGDCQVTYWVGDQRTVEEVPAGQRPEEGPALPEGYTGWWDAQGRDLEPGETEVWWDRTFVACRTVSLNTADHNKYMDGSTDGLFHPDQSMTRAEAVQVLYALLSQRPQEQVSYSDVPSGAWYADAVRTLGAMGALDCLPGGSFRPDDPITRGELALILSRFLPRHQAAVPAFSDVLAQDPAYGAIGVVTEAGLFSGYPDGTFRPGEAVTRAQAAAVFNQLLGRVPDTQAIATAAGLRLFPDLSPDHWAYAQIMEATVSHDYTSLGGETWTRVEHEPTALADGYYHFGDWLYRVQDGMFLRSTTVDGFTFDNRGRYTTGLPELDEQLHQIIRQYTNDSMTRDEKLRALYNHVRDDFTYLSRPLVSRGATGWEPEYALEFLELGRGNCFSFSALFCLLSRQLGLPAYTVVGGLGSYSAPHGWVEMELDGVIYMFDPQLEWRYLHDYGRSGYDLFMVLPSQARFTYLR